MNRFLTSLAVLTIVLTGCNRTGQERREVVLYTSQDQFCAEPILKAFTAETGIEVKPVFDTESAKTAGLARRLRAEQKFPQCDVFWSNEELHTRLLAQAGIVASNEWRAAGYRTRCLVINTNLLAPNQAPGSLLELTNATWSGRFALAYPLFGTTSSHFLALRQNWGEEIWKRWCQGLVQNGAKTVDGNSVVVKLVGRGEVPLGLTDSDDFAAGLAQGLPIAEVPLRHDGFVIRSTAGLIQNAPHPEEARRLLDYLARPETVRQLVKLNALQGVEPGDQLRETLPISWERAPQDLESANEFLEFVFIRS